MKSSVIALAHKAATLVQRAFASVQYNLNPIELFHTDRGSEFKNQLIDDTLGAFGIERSLSKKGSPYDNAVTEAMFKTIKTEFINGTVFIITEDAVKSPAQAKLFECEFKTR